MCANRTRHVSRVLSLYKVVLRLHRALPLEMQLLGDSYAREEFRRHKSRIPRTGAQQLALFVRSCVALFHMCCVTMWICRVWSENWRLS